MPKVSFTTPIITAIQEEFKSTQRGVTGVMVNVLDLNRNFLRVILHVGAEYFGLEVYKLAVAQGKKKIDVCS